MMTLRNMIVLVFLCALSPAYAAPLPKPVSQQDVQQTKEQVQALQERLLSDKEIMGLLQILQENPDVQALLQNPEVLSAITNGDVAALTGNPYFLKLFDNPQIQEIQKRINQ